MFTRRDNIQKRLLKIQKQESKTSPPDPIPTQSKRKTTGDKDLDNRKS